MKAEREHKCGKIQASPALVDTIDMKPNIVFETYGTARYPIQDDHSLEIGAGEIAGKENVRLVI